MIASTFAQTPPIETGVSQALAQWRAAHYSDVRYKLNITLEKGAPQMKGAIEINVKLKTENGKLNPNDAQIVLDWRKIRGKEDLSTVSNVSINGAAAKFEEINEHLVFKDGVKPGENTIKLDFTSPILTSGGAITRYIDKEDGAEYIYSLFVPSDASTAFPVFDQPDLKARFTLSVEFPGGWRVISNTNSSCGRICAMARPICYFKETKPISTYVFAFAAGDFTEVSEPSALADGLTRASNNSKINENDSKNSNASNAKLKPPADAGGSDLSSKIYVRKSQAEKFKQHSKEVFRLNREGVKFLEDWFDYKFPFPKYDLVLIPEFPFGGMEHAGATFLREDRIIFPTEPTKNDFITRANLIFHEAAHQWFGDTVTMKWFDDLWLKEGFAEFMAYKTLEKVMPEYNAWKIFYERNKQAAYLTDITRGTTPIYQEISNLSAAKSAYGNIVYRKAPSFLKQAEFFLGEKEFQTAVRAFLKKHEFKNAEWTDLVKEFETASKQDLDDWASIWVKQRGIPIISYDRKNFSQKSSLGDNTVWQQKTIIHTRRKSKAKFFEDYSEIDLLILSKQSQSFESGKIELFDVAFVFPNYGDYGYGIFLLDEKSRAYILANIQNEKGDFMRSMMWGALWDSLRFYELAPEDYVELVIKNINVESDESTIQSLLGRVGVAMNYYLSEPPASAGGTGVDKEKSKSNAKPPANADGSDLQLENLLLEKMQTAPTLGLRITYYRAFLNIASSEKARNVLKEMLQRNTGIPAGIERADGGKTAGRMPVFQLKTKDKFDIVTRLITLNDPDALKLLAELEKTETDDAAKRYAYAARAGIPNAENKAKFWNDFVNNKEISESWIESAFAVWNSPRHADLTLPYLEKALAELPNLKRNRKIFFVNGWLSSFIGGQKSAEALKIVNDFLDKNPNLDRDLRLKILENVDGLERAVKIREKYGEKN